MTLPIRRFAYGVTLPALFLAAACSEPTTTAPADDGLAPTVLTSQFTLPAIVDDQVTVCKTGSTGDFDFSISVVADDGSLLVPDPFSLTTENCVLVWTGDDDQDPAVVTVGEINIPVWATLEKIEVHREGQVTQVVTGASSVEVGNINTFHGAVIVFHNSGEPPVEVCDGLTPGYWRNWSNHYTEAEFLSLLVGTIAEGDVVGATEILSYGGPDAVQRIAKFLLANQLTLNLTGTDLPNPDGATLHPDCEIDGHGALGDALQAALDIWNNGPGELSKQELNAIKDALDAFANLNVD